MYSFLNPNGNKLVVLKVTILVTLLGHVVILGYNFVETLKVLLTLNIQSNFYLFTHRGEKAPICNPQGLVLIFIGKY